MKYQYALLYRPPSTFTLPKGWELVERPRQKPHNFERRTDLPESRHAFGVVAYDRALTADEIAAFQLKAVHAAAVWGVWCSVSRGVTGSRQAWLKSEGQVMRFTREEAEAEAARLNTAPRSGIAQFYYEARRLAEGV